MKDFVPRNNTPYPSVINILLAAGLVFIVLGILLLIYFFTDTNPGLEFWLPAAFFCMGTVLLYRGFTRHVKSGVVFTGFFLSIGAILILLSNSSILPFSLVQLWPLFSVVFAVSLICSGLYKYRGLRPRYFVPAIMMLFLGGVLSLFSFDIIKLSFSAFAGKFWPVILILAGVGLLVLFVYQKKLQSFHFGVDEIDLFEDDGEDF